MAQGGLIPAVGGFPALFSSPRVFESRDPKPVPVSGGEGC